MCQVHAGTYGSLIAPEKIDYTASHPGKATTYMLHVVSVITHTLKSIGINNEHKRNDKKRKARKAKKEIL